MKKGATIPLSYSLKKPDSSPGMIMACGFSFPAQVEGMTLGLQHHFANLSKADKLKDKKDKKDKIFQDFYKIGIFAQQ